MALRPLYPPLHWFDWPDGNCPFCAHRHGRMPSNDPEAVCCTFLRLSRKTWHTLRAARDAGISYSETSITDENLLWLRLAHPGAVVVRKNSQKAEKATGADWEWWFTDRHHAWGARVQAKRLTDGLTYLAFHRLQGRALVERAARDGMGSMYCFYNWSVRPDQSRSPCPCGEAEEWFFGCAIADAGSVLRSCPGRGALRLSHVAGMSRPWSCLVCCGSQRGRPLPYQAAAVYAELVGDVAVRAAEVRPLERCPEHVLALQRAAAGQKAVVVIPPDTEGVFIVTSGG